MPGIECELPRVGDQEGHRSQRSYDTLLDSADMRRSGLQPVPYINVAAIGFTEYALYFNLAVDERWQFLSALEKLTHMERISWTAQYCGAFEFGIGILAAGPCELVEIMNLLSHEMGISFGRKAISIQTAGTRYSRKFLSAGTLEGLRMRLERGNSTAKRLDDADHRILSALANSCYTSLRDIAKFLGLPLSTVQYRVTRFQESGVILGWILPVSAKRLGRQAYRLLVDLKQPQKSMRERFMELCENHPNITEMVACVGSWEYELLVETESPEDLLALTTDLSCKFKEVNQVQVLTIIKESRYSGYPLAINNSPRYVDCQKKAA